MGKRQRNRALRAGELDRVQATQLEIVEQQLSYWSGPLPSPEVLRGYDEIMPGAAERVLAMAERQSRHRQNMENKALAEGARRAYLGSWFGFIIGILALSGGLFLAIQGQPLGGYAIIIWTITMLTSVFVYGRRSAKQELKTKRTGP